MRMQQTYAFLFNKNMVQKMLPVLRLTVIQG